jgi:hypothetical protein
MMMMMTAPIDLLTEPLSKAAVASLSRNRYTRPLLHTTNQQACKQAIELFEIDCAI